jgi:hypothetical protein
MHAILNLFLQFALISLAFAEETVSTAAHGNALKYGSGGGIIGFIVLILDIIVGRKCSQSFHDHGSMLILI